MLLLLVPFIVAVRALTSFRRTPRNSWAGHNFTSLVTFGDSYTDELRLSYFSSNNGTAPPVGWVQPVGSATSTGGYIWPRYVSWYTSLILHNYAVSGAVCSNDITPRIYLSQFNFLFPSVLEYEVPAFLADKAFVGPTTNTTAPITIDDDKTVYTIWIGTNDLGNDAFLTDSQVKGKQITDYIDCVYASLQKIYAAGGRWFILMNVIPSNIIPQYALPSNGGAIATSFFQDKAKFNSTEVSYRMMGQVGLVNQAFQYRTPFEVKLGDKFKGANFAYFDVNSLFSEMYNNPSAYLNGTAPLNVTSWINRCSENDCPGKLSPDSYLWYDGLHPSEQAGRNVAKEFVQVVKGESRFATYWSS
ncbi:carbohydrate esterase family 16 protein [Venturia nashicola]|nr:carbohydrate esterase family 16 protein [Venturia nashicola]